MYTITLKDLFRIHADDLELAKAQVTALSQQMPMFYFILCANIIALSSTYFGVAPDWLILYIPIAMVAFAVVRLVTWVLIRGKELTHEQNIGRLQTMFRLAILVAFFSAVWAISLYPYGGPMQRGHLAFFIAVTLITCLFACIQHPRAALTGLIVVTGVTCVFFMSTGDPITMVMAANFALVGIVIFSLIRSYFGAFSGLVKSRQELKQKNAAMKTLNTELAWHRDHLSEKVRQRTEALHRQTVKLEKSLAAEKELNRLQSEFVAMASHEIRTPLAIIDGLARRIGKSAGEMPKEDVEDRVERIRAAVARLSNLVERTLDSSKLTAGNLDLNLAPFDPCALIEEIVERHRELSPQHEFTLNLQDLPSTVCGDVRMMDHILSNLISNAIKYSQKNPRIAVEGRQDGDRYALSIRDHGVGIPAEELPKIASRFFRASTSTGIQGTGLGLNFVKDLVERHNGRMDVSSEVGCWTEVTLDLPLNATAQRRSGSLSSAVA